MTAGVARRAICAVVVGLGLVALAACGATDDGPSSVAGGQTGTTAGPSGSSGSPGSSGSTGSPSPSGSPVEPSQSVPEASDSPESPRESDYCEALVTLIGLERPELLQGAVAQHDFEARYRALLQSVADESPPHQRPTWELLLTVVDEPFTYDNFNPAVDSLERIYPELNAECRDLEFLVVDDDGRLASLLLLED